MTCHSLQLCHVLVSATLQPDLLPFCTTCASTSCLIGILTMCLSLKDPDVYVKNDLSRFIWNFLALRTASGPARLASGMATQAQGRYRHRRPRRATAGR